MEHLLPGKFNPGWSGRQALEVASYCVLTKAGRFLGGEGRRPEQELPVNS